METRGWKWTVWQTLRLGRDQIQLGLHAISYSKGKARPKYEREQRIQRELEETNRLFENDRSASNSLRLDDIKEK